MRSFAGARSNTLRTMAVVCLAIAIAVGLFSVWRSGGSPRIAQAATTTETDAAPVVWPESSAPPRAPESPPLPEWKVERAAYEAMGDAPVRVLPPTDVGDSAPPVLTMLHGMGSHVGRTCDRVASAKDAGFVVVCPTGNVDYGDGTGDWAGDAEVKAAHIDAALRAALGPLALEPSAARGDVLVGFSRGAFVARDVAYARAGQWRGLVLIGAALTPDAARLRENGVRRVVLASGDFDGAKRTMVAARAKLCAEGMPARFVSLGPVWHALPEDSMKRLAEAIAWARGEGEDAVPGCAATKS